MDHSNDSFDTERCEYLPTPFMEERFWLVTVTGTTIAVISIVQNVFLFIVLVTKKVHRQSHQLYLIFLAFFDLLVATAYIPLMSVSQLADHFLSPLLLRAWYSYMVPTITISHIAMTSSSFLILAATIERYCLTATPQRMDRLKRSRVYIAVFAVLLGVLTKSSLALEFHIRHNWKCASTMAEYTLELSKLAKNPTYNLIWRLWFRNIITILLPFFLLAFMNTQIVIVLQRATGGDHSSNGDIFNEKQLKDRVRAATRTLVLVVFTYLLSNVLNVIITIWEYIDIETLMSEYISFYTYSADLVSLLTILAGALRLWIYAMCQKQLRKDFIRAAFRLIRLPAQFKVRADAGKFKTFIVARCMRNRDEASADEVFL